MVPLGDMANQLFPNFRLKHFMSGYRERDGTEMTQRYDKSGGARRRGAMMAAALLCTLIASPAFADVKTGVDAWSRGEYKKAVETWRPLAIEGDADAQFNLGQAYKLGRGVPVDLPLAEEWYRKAALQNHLQAEDAYGLTLFQNNKRAEAITWLERSAGRGEPRAQLVLGTMLFNGDNVKKDWVRAYALLTRSAAAGLPQGAQTLAQMDQYIPADTRQQGIALARQYESSTQRPTETADVAGQGSGDLRSTELPASTYASDGDSRPTLTPVPQPVKRPVKSAPVQVAAKAVTPTPGGQFAEPAPARAMPGQGWRVQFGAFRDQGNARGLWQQLQAKVGALAPLRPIYAPSGTLTKLQTGPLASRADASRLCSAVQGAIPSTPCVPIAP